MNNPQSNAQPDSAQPAKADVKEINHSLCVLHPGADAVVEIRAPGNPTIAGFFDRDHYAEAAQLAAQLDAAGVYVVLNTIQPDALGPARNYFAPVSSATGDQDIAHRDFLLIDVDPVRPPKVSSTAAEKAHAKTVCAKVLLYLKNEMGWPQPIVADSGNGYHLLFAIDLDNDEFARELVKDTLCSLAAMFDTPYAKIDTTVFNASRICKLYGTVAAKGAHTAERPHRLARILSTPAAIQRVSVEKLQGVANLGPKPEPKQAKVEAEERRDYPQTTMDEVRAALSFIDPTPRETWLYCGMGIKAEFGDSGRGLWDAWSQRAGNVFDDADQQKAWSSMRRNGIGIGTVFHLAQQGGYERGHAFRRDTSPPPAAPAVEWPDPVRLDDDNLPPLPAESFPLWVQDMVHAVSIATETPRELATSYALGAMSAALQGKFEVELKPGYREPLNLFVVAALDSGNRKTAALGLMTGPIARWEYEEAQRLGPVIKAAKSQRETDLARIASRRKAAARLEGAEYEAEKHAIAALEAGLPPIPVEPRLLCDDVTTEKLGALMAEHDGRMALITDEGGIFDTLAGRYSGGFVNFDLYLKAHSGSPVGTDRTSRERVQILKPALTLVVSPQPGVIAGLASTPAFRAKGLLGRILWFLPKSTLGFRTGDTPGVPPAVSQAYEEGIRALLEIPTPPEPHIIELSREAFVEWNYFRKPVETALLDGGMFEHAHDWAGKLPGLGARIAGVNHCAEHRAEAAEQTMLPDVMGKALDLAAVGSKHALATFSLMGAGQVLRDARKLWRWIDRNRQMVVSFRDAHHDLQGSFPLAEDLDPAFRELLNRNYLEERPKTQTRGRPSRIFEVNPKLTEHWEEDR